jgi:tRNA nucleotidyltransferase/poly(A) polymerase
VTAELDLAVESDRCVVMLRAIAEEACCGAVDIVGGWVRDRLLGLEPCESPDMDVRVATDDIGGVVEVLLARFGGSAKITRDFPTARWRGGGGGDSQDADRTLDLAAFRAEDYPGPGANPEVRQGSSAEDLARRDFACNAIGYRIWPLDESGLIDEHGGVGDIEDRRLRLLHLGSFLEDPTRVLRAARYVSRLGFELGGGEREALRQLLAGSPILRTGSRLRSEWARLLEDPSPSAGIRCLLEWSAGGLIGLPELGRGDARLARLDACLGTDLESAARDPLRVLALLCGSEGCAAAAEWFSLSEDEGARLHLLAAAPQRWALTAPSDLRQLDEQVRLIPGDCRVQLGLSDVGQDALLQRWEAEVADLAPLITGADLLASGWAQGPELGEVLRHVRAAQLEGKLASPAAALDKARAWRADKES